MGFSKLHGKGICFELMLPGQNVEQEANNCFNRGIEILEQDKSNEDGHGSIDKAKGLIKGPVGDELLEHKEDSDEVGLGEN